MVGVLHLFGESILVSLFAGKKGEILWSNWVEYVCFFLLIIGFIFAVLSSSPLVSYLVAFLSGFMFGRLWYLVREKEKFAYMLMILFFIIGLIRYHVVDPDGMAP